jgi:hypothetical protein
MSSALDNFEKSLVDASRALHAPAGSVASPRQRSSRSSARSWRPLLAPATMAAVLAAALFGVLAILPSGGGQPALGVGQASAQAVLARAAAIAASTPASTVPNAHQFLYIKWIRSSTGTQTTKGHTYAFTNGQTEQDWEAPDGPGRQKLSNGFYTFLRPVDRAAWKAAGRPPISKGLNIDGTYPRGAYFNECGISPRGTIGLSTDPARLLRQVIDRYEGHHYNPGSTLAMAACVLVSSAYPPLKAATYRMIEHLQGVEYLGPMHDGIGRRGVGVAVPDRKAGIRSVVILDRVSAMPLELEAIQTRVNTWAPPGISRRTVKEQELPNGTVVNSQILLSSGVVDTEEALPGGGHVAFKHPPKIKVTQPSVPANPAQPSITTLPALRDELAILRRPQNPIDRMPVWEVKDEERQGCSNCLNMPTLIPAETRLLATFPVPRAYSRGRFGLHGPQRVYLVIGKLNRHWGVKPSEKNQIPRITMNGWHQRGSALLGLHLSIVAFLRRNTRIQQPIDVELNSMQTTMPAQVLTPRDVMIGEFGSVGIVPDGVTRVRWELIDPGQSHPVTVYPRIEGNVATAPVTPSHEKTGLMNEQLLASAVWYGAHGRVIASVNALPATMAANSNW